MVVPKIKNRLNGWTLAAIIFFAILVGLGAAIYRDYGVSWDEQNQLAIGRANYLYITQGDPALLSLGDRYYGGIYELLLYRLADFPQTDQVFFTRHLITFFTFVAGVLVFYFLIRRLWKKDWLALLGCLALVLSPRIFGDSFYNTKDIPFLVAFIGAIYTLVRYCEAPSWKNLILHTFTSAILIAIRVPGVTIAALTGGIFVLELLFQAGRTSENIKSKLAHLAVYMIAGSALVVLFWPILWHDPLGEFVTAFRQMSSFPFTRYSLFKGFLIQTIYPPVTYLPTWIAITTPILYLAGFAAGLFSAAYTFVFKPGRLVETEKRNLLIVLVWFFFPVLAVTILRSTLYDGWRQLFFIAPALVLLALEGLQGVIRLTDRLGHPAVAHWVIAGLVLVGFIDPLGFMIQYHPFQNLYFNCLAGANLVEDRARYDMDYWGLSGRKAIEYILEADPASVITIISDSPAALNNALIQPEDQRKRLKFTDDFAQADYFLASYHGHPQDYPYPNEVYSFAVDGAKLVSVFRLH